MLGYGSLDWLMASDIQSFFSATPEDQLGATSGCRMYHSATQKAGLVISNPPFTSDGAATGERKKR